MKNMNIVLTMGGLGSRFRKVGYNVPKYMIEVKGKTLFDWAVSSLKGYENLVKQYLFIAMNDNEIDVKKFIEEQCLKMNIVNYKSIIIDYLTDGQASTAMLGKIYWQRDDSLLIYNIDTYVEPGYMKSEDLKGDGFIPCFKADGDHWSFVKVNENGRAMEIREKYRISDNCTVGAYYFRTCELYETLYNEFYNHNKNLINGEKYIAPLYNYLIEKGGEVYISNIDPMKVHVLGTPEELQRFLNK